MYAKWAEPDITCNDKNNKTDSMGPGDWAIMYNIAQSTEE